MAILGSAVDTGAPAFRINAAQMRALVADLQVRRAQAAEEGLRSGAPGALAPRERVVTLLDPGAPLLELSPLAGVDLYDDPGAGLIAGIGRVEARTCMVIADDAGFGAYLPLTVKKMLRAQEIARDNRLPCLYLVDSRRPSLVHQADVFADREHFGRILFNQADMSARGIVQIAVVFGDAGMPTIADETIIVSRGGTGARDTGDEFQALVQLRRVVAQLGFKRRSDVVLRVAQEPARHPAELDGIVPVDLAKPFAMQEVIARLVDASEFEAFKPGQGDNLVTGFALLHGIPLGVLANAGPLDTAAAHKGADFVARADKRGIPLLFLQNVAEVAADGSALAAMISAVACATVPKITVVVGAAHGIGHYAMGGRALGPRFVFTWPNARISLMAGDAAASALAAVARRRIETKRGKWSEVEEAEFKQPIRERYEDEAGPYYATARLWDDGIIAPQETRRVLALAFAATLNA